MENTKAMHQLVLIHLDVLIIKVTEGGKDVHMLVIMAQFTCYVQALVISPQTAKCTAQALWDRLIVHNSLPESIVSDQGQKFESDLIAELCKLAKGWKYHTSPYHPQTNEQCNCFNNALINMFDTLSPKKMPS